MSVFGTNQVEELMIGHAESTETTVAGFTANANDKELAVLPRHGGVLAAGDNFYILQKTSGSATKGLNYEFSDEVEPKMVDKIIMKKYADEVAKSVQATFDASITVDTLYELKIRVLNDGGTLSPENFRHITGSHLVKTGDDLAAIIAGVKSTLENSLKLEGTDMFVITSDATSITVTGVIQNVIPGRDEGRPVEFDIEAGVYNNDMSAYNLGLISTSVISVANKGIGTGKYAVNLEWFTKGFKYDRNRNFEFFSSFDAPIYADKNGKYNVIHIKYKKQRAYTSVENQHKVLTILVDAGSAGTDYIEVNKIGAKLATVTGITVTPLS